MCGKGMSSLAEPIPLWEDTFLIGSAKVLAYENVVCILKVAGERGELQGQMCPSYSSSFLFFPSL